MKNSIAIVSGEPESINSEIIAKSWKSIKPTVKKRLFVIGSYSLINQQLKKMKIFIPLKRISSISEINSSKKLNILDVPLSFINPFKVSSKPSAKYVIKCLNLAHSLAFKKKIKGFINCAIDKKKVFKSNFGVTEFLAKKNNIKGSEAMLIYNKNYSVVPATTHIKINMVSKKLSKKMIENKIKVINKFYVKHFKKKPIIAVLGLNPHNNELNVNSEENKIIIPTIKKCKKEKIKIIGPLPADTVFNNQKKYKFDVILGMYHDQVLAPFKALFGYDAVNITIGLKYLRISPDHGTAKDIVGKNKGNFKSLNNSINFITKNDNT